MTKEERAALFDARLSAIEEAIRHLGRRLDEMQVSDPALKVALRAATIAHSMKVNP
jgi:hypothetical protein